MRHIRVPTPVLAHPQHGAALIIGLIMLLILSLLGVTAISSVTLQEKMAGGLVDRNRAFQAAETTLREVETALSIPAQESVISNSDEGFYDLNAGTEQPDPYDVALWEDDFISGPAIDGISDDRTPRYRVERQIKISDSHPTTYRITAIGYGNRAGSSVVLQTTFGVLIF